MQISFFFLFFFFAVGELMRNNVFHKCFMSSISACSVVLFRCMWCVVTKCQKGCMLFVV